MKLMKSVIVCLLLLMNQPHPTSAADPQTADLPPIFSLSQVHKDSTTKLLQTGYIASELGRLAIYSFVKPVNGKPKEYLMRVDPPEHCTRYVICNTDPDKNIGCEAKESIIVFPHQEGGAVYHKKVSVADPTKIAPLEKNLQLDGTILIRHVTLDNNNFNFEIEFTAVKLAQEMTDKIDEKKKINTIKFGTDNDLGLRVETSSFYCKVHLGTTNNIDDEVPTMHPYTSGKAYSDSVVKVDPLTANFAKSIDTDTSKIKNFGPMFFRYVGAKNQLTKYKPEKPEYGQLDNYKADKAQCPFSHDWLGFSAWARYDGSNKKAYLDSLWKNPVYHYKLTKNTAVANTACGDISLPYQIDIDIDEAFGTELTMEGARCFGFALSFGTAFANEKLHINAKRMFEFYIVSMMMLTPDSDKIRELRVPREALRKIRISFYTKSDIENYAIVEYGFLNDRIAGVREFVQLDKNEVKKYETVSLFTEGFCKVRVLNVNHHTIETPSGRCMNIEGCDVLIPNFDD